VTNTLRTNSRAATSGAATSGAATSRVTAARVAASLVAAVAGAALLATAPATAAPATTAPATGPAATGPAGMTAACAERPGPYAHCLTLYRPQAAVNRARAAGDLVTPDGWGATDLRTAYRLPDAASTTTVAVAIAYDAPDLEQDLATYRQQYGLPPCTTANGCFTKVNQSGQAAPLPTFDDGWALEATLDVSMISAACPSCHIDVVEADSPTLADLAATESTAVGLGAQVVSNSYGGRELGQDQQYAAAYRQPGHTIVVSSGDTGFTAASFPAALDSVVAVGGTELTAADNDRGYAESVWTDGRHGAAGSGCSAYVAKPSWQHDPHCGMRTVADVAAAADDIAIYDSADGGWLTVAGTSASAPFIAGVYGLAGNATTATPADLYAHAADLNDVTAGTNDLSGGAGAKCGNDYLCVATTGYDAPTGLGTPIGTAAF
jgi:subtilase family protein